MSVDFSLTPFPSKTLRIVASAHSASNEFSAGFPGAPSQRAAKAQLGRTHANLHAYHVVISSENLLAILAEAHCNHRLGRSPTADSFARPLENTK